VLAIGLAAAPLSLTLACGSSSTTSRPANAWRQVVPAGSATAPNSSALVARLARGGPAVADLYEFGTPVFDAVAGTPQRSVRCTLRWGTCTPETQPVPIPDDAHPAPGSDGAMVVTDRATDSAYEFYKAKRLGDGNWSTGWASRTVLDGDGRSGETGSGTSLLSGLVRTDEIRAGRIDHALQLASSYTCRSGVEYPAVKTDGHDDAPDCLPMGSRLQLDPALDVDTLPGLGAGERMIARAWQRYGAFVQNSAGAPLVVGFENPAGKPDPYPAAGLAYDYAPLRTIPLDKLRKVAAP